MDTTSVLQIIAIVLLLIGSAYFSAAEQAYSATNKVRLKTMVEQNKKNAKLALKLEDNYDKLLSSILIGNNIMNITSTSIATVLFTRYFLGYGPTLSTIVMTLVILFCSEITPKCIVKEMPEKVAMHIAPSAYVVMIILTPVCFMFSSWKKLVLKIAHLQPSSAITEEEIITMVSEAENEGGLGEQESELIRSAIEFNDVEVSEILTPRVDVTAVEDTATHEELAKAYAETGYSRIPVYHDTIDNIIGLIHEKDFYLARYHGKTDIMQLITPVTYTAETTKISELLQTLQSSGSHMAVVVDEYGGTSGIVTLEDILEELVGEIWDEHDEVKADFQKQGDGSYLVSGDANLDDVFELFGLYNRDSDSATVSGWVIEVLRRLPKSGDHFISQNLDVTVTKLSHRHVLQVRIQQLEEPPEEEHRRNSHRDRDSDDS